MIVRYCKITIIRIGFMLLAVPIIGFGQGFDPGGGPGFDPAIGPGVNMDFYPDQQRTLEQLMNMQELNQLGFPSDGIRYKNFMVPGGVSDNERQNIFNLLDELERICPTCAQVPGALTGSGPYTLPDLSTIRSLSPELQAELDPCAVPSWLDEYIPEGYDGCRREYVKTKLQQS